MDRAGLIESQSVTTAWQDQSIQEQRLLDYANRFGTQEPSRLPMRRCTGSVFFFSQSDRIQEPERKLNLRASRYHGPGGLQNDSRDMFGIADSRPKIEEYEFHKQEIKSNPGILGSLA